VLLKWHTVIVRLLTCWTSSTQGNQSTD